MACLISSTIASISARIGYLAFDVKRPGLLQEAPGRELSGTLPKQDFAVNRRKGSRDDLTVGQPLLGQAGQ